MYSEIEIFMLGFVGGLAGSSIIFYIIYFYYNYMIKDYTDAQYFKKEQCNCKKIKDDVANLKMQVVALHSQYGVNE